MQDSITGNMIPMTPEQVDKAMKQSDRDLSIFSVGEILEIKGGRFRIQKITKKGLILKGLPKERT